jgi:hypothetical protein
MRLFAIAGLMIASTCFAQEQVPIDQQATAESGAQTQTTSVLEKQPLGVAAGTRVRMKLANPIRTRLARRGDGVRAVTVFPVTAGTVVAIPAGTYLDGTIERVTKRGSGLEGLQIHFSRMLFSNGYTVALDGSAAEAKASAPNADGSEVAGVAGAQGAGVSGQAFQQSPGLTPPTLPPLPRLGPSPAVVAGVAIGAMAAGVIAVVALAHHRGHDVLLDAGTQFDMILESSLLLDGDRVADAVAAAAAQ